MDNNKSKFAKFERIFFRIEVFLLGISIFLYLLYLWVQEYLGPFVDFILLVIIISIAALVVIFFISIFRIFTYLIKHRSDESASIWRSVINLFLSPLSLIIFYILIFITAATSCTYGG